MTAYRDPPGRPLVIAHRGASTRAPENTLAAFRTAKQAGADWIELDVQLTADGRVICLHDFTLSRTTDFAAQSPETRAPEASSCTLAEIRRLDAGAWFGPAFSGERVPTLAEAVKAGGEGSLPLLIEIKDVPRYGARVDALLAETVRILRAARLPDPARPFGGVILQSFHPEALARLVRTAPEFTRFQLVPPFAQFIPERFPTFEAALDATAAYAAGIGLPDREATGDVAAAIHARGLRVFVWTVNDTERMRVLAALGVDGLITDDPAAAVEVLAVGG